MTDIIQNPTQNSIPPVTEPTPPVPSLTISQMLKNVIEKARPVLNNVFNKFYSNKKIFWPVSIAFGLIFLIIILGLLFGRRNASQKVSATPSPIPVVQSTPQASSSGDILLDSQSKLNDLKNQINALDVKESHLSPPTLDFNIKFDTP